VHATERAFERAARAGRHRLNFSSGSHDFDDRIRHREQMLLVVAGYKEYLWPFTLERVARVVPADIDVCVVCPGKDSSALRALCATKGWSYLCTKANRLALAQNLAIEQHPDATWIHKLDEDIFVAPGYFDAMRSGYDAIVAAGEYDPGCVAPVLNVNGFAYVSFLESKNATGAYRERFGEARRAAAGVRGYTDGASAVWLWEQTLPFETTAAEFAARPFAYEAASIRFSIGAILLRREFWSEIGGFLVHPMPARLGAEEAHLCAECLLRSRPLVVLNTVLAGHFSFWPQEEAMRELLEARRADFEIPAPAVQ